MPLGIFNQEMTWTKYMYCSLILLVYLIDISYGLGNPYKILGIPASSTVTEIRKAYKQLAKEWYGP